MFCHNNYSVINIWQIFPAQMLEQIIEGFTEFTAKSSLSQNDPVI